MVKSKVLSIIVTYNAMKWAERCFSSLSSSTLLPDIFVIDNGSTDGTQEYIKKHFPHVIFYQSNKNLGFGKANNIGLKYALEHSYDYVYLLNQDAWVFPNTLDDLIDISKKHPNYGILSPFQMNSDMCHIDQSFVQFVCSYSSNSELFSDIYTKKIRDVYSVSGVMAAHWLITISCLKAVGGFSPTFKHYGEDYDYIERALYHKFMIGIVPSLKVVHDRGNRIESKRKLMYLSYTTKIRMLSNPNIKFNKALVIVIFGSIIDAYRYKSFKPLGDFVRLTGNIIQILRNKRIGKNTVCAFLN